MIPIKNIRVIDGDTVEADIHIGFDIVLKKQRIRLLDIDMCETRGKEKHDGAHERAYLRRLVQHNSLFINENKVPKKDSFGRWLCELWTEHLCINKHLRDYHIERHDGSEW